MKSAPLGVLAGRTGHQEKGLLWSRRLPKNLVLKDGREIRTLSDARDLTLPERRHDKPHWEYAAELLTTAARGGGTKVDAFSSRLELALEAEGLI
jgi:hypothetical protein